MTRASARGTGIWDGVRGREGRGGAAGGGTMQEIKVFFLGIRVNVVI